MKDRPWMWCQYIWVMFDFAADQRTEGDHPGRNDKGLVTADRKIRKDAFYFYKANWNASESLVHITSRRFEPRPTGPTTLKVYSNADSVELYVNNKSLGKRQGDTCVFTWPDATLREGRNIVRAVGTMKNGRRVSDTVMWTASRGATTRMNLPPSTAPTPVPTTAPTTAP
jgi:beta-galactosidase